MKNISQEFVTVAQGLDTGSPRPESDVATALLVKYRMYNANVISIVSI